MPEIETVTFDTAAGELTYSFDSGDPAVYTSADVAQLLIDRPERGAADAVAMGWELP